jgi:hypothetical protein
MHVLSLSVTVPWLSREAHLLKGNMSSWLPKAMYGRCGSACDKYCWRWENAVV